MQNDIFTTNITMQHRETQTGTTAGPTEVEMWHRGHWAWGDTGTWDGHPVVINSSSMVKDVHT